MRIVLFFLLFLFTTPISTSKNGCLNIDIMLIGDLSGSVDDKEYFVADAFDAFIDRFDLSNNTIRIGLIIFESDAHLLSSFTTNKKELKKATTYIRDNDLSGTSNLFSAIEVAWFQFTLDGRPDSRKMIIVVSDGDVDEREYTEELIYTMKKQSNIEVCGILVDTYSTRETFMVNISEPYCYVSTGYDMLVNELEKIDICI